MLVNIKQDDMKKVFHFNAKENADKNIFKFELCNYKHKLPIFTRNSEQTVSRKKEPIDLSIYSMSVTLSCSI